MDSITEVIAAPVPDATEIRNESPTKNEYDEAATVKTPPLVAESTSPACQQQSPDSTVSVVDSTVPAVVDGLTETVVVGEASTTIAEITSEQSLENALQAASTTAKRVSFSEKAPEYIQPSSEDPPEVAAESETPLSDNKFDGVFDFDLLLEPLPIRTALTQLLCLDDAGISAYLRTEPAAADAETSAWLVACAREDAAGRRYAILKEAIVRHILYSYCDVLYVLNPHCTAPDGLQPDSFARRIATNYKVDVELAPPAAAVVPRPRSIPAAPKTQLQKGDQLSVVLQRMREINPQVFEKELAGIRVNAESCMLLDLLSMSEPARNQYILQCAVDRRLLSVDTQTQQLEVNPRLHSKFWMKFDAFKCEDNARGIVEQSSAPDTAVVVAGPSAAELAEKAAEAAQKAAEKAAYKAAKKAEQAEVAAVRVAWQAAAKAQNAAVKAEKAAIAAAAPPDLTKKAKKKLAAAHAAEVAAGGPRKETENVVVKPGKKDKAQTLADMQDATKCMQRLMIEYKQMRPDCDAASSSSSISGAGGGGSRRKRGARGASHTTSLSREYRTSIICSLQEILLKVQNNSSQLGQLSEPHEYDAFLRTFDKTVLMIQQRLYSNPIPAPKTLPLPTPLPVKSASAPAPTRYSDYVNQLTTYVTNSYKYRMQPLVEPAKPTDDYFGDERNVAIIDRFVAKLLADNWGKLVEGDIRINAYNLTQGYITSADTVDDTIVETLLLRQCAMHSDIVRVFVFKPNVRTKDRSNPLGFVVRVLEQRNDRIVLGHAVPNKNRNYFMLHPTNRRVPVLRINKTTELHEISDQLLYMARITGWLSDGQCWGEIVRVIGDRTVLATNNEAILLYNKLEVPSFSETIVSALPSDTFQIPREEFAKRTDLTAECIFTIDPETARDLDDALSVKQLPNGNYEVGVHISDVTYFIAENGELDRQIRQQATSIYLVDNVYHMLPRSLCMTCSLLPGQDKLAFSVFWEMNEAGDVLSTRYARTVIRSCVQLSYAHAQRMLDEPQRQWSAEELPAISGGFDARHLVERVGQLHRLARPLRERRFARHCLKIDQPKIVFKLDENSGEPLQFERYRQCDSNWLIEEFMLLANQSVAQTIYDAYPDRAMLRNHMPPKQSGVVLLAEKLKQYDFRLDASTPHTISTSMYSLMNNPAIPANVMAVLTEWLTRPMNRAHYICSSPQTDRSHFALSIPIYTHFTSPIRRYPDVLVHRLLAAALRLADEPALRPDELETIAERCNEQKYNAKCASEASTELYFAHYVRRCKAVEMRAVVTEVVNAEMFELMLLDTGAKLKVVVPKHKPSVQFSMNHKKPLSGVLQFKETDPSTGRAARVRVEVFAELLVSVTVTDTNVLKASIVPFSK